MLLFTPVSTTLPRDTDDADFVSNNTNSFRGVKIMNEQKNTTKTQIKQAAIRQIEKFGIDKTSMRSIAAEARIYLLRLSLIRFILHIVFFMKIKTRKSP